MKICLFLIFYTYLGTVSFKNFQGQNSAPLLVNNVMIKLLRVCSSSFSLVLRKNSAQTQSIKCGVDKPESPNQLRTSKLDYYFPAHLTLVSTSSEIPNDLQTATSGTQRE